MRYFRVFGNLVIHNHEDTAAEFVKEVQAATLRRNLIKCHQPSLGETVPESTDGKATEPKEVKKAEKQAVSQPTAPAPKPEQKPKPNRLSTDACEVLALMVGASASAGTSVIMPGDLLSMWMRCSKELRDHGREAFATAVEELVTFGCIRRFHERRLLLQPDAFAVLKQLAQERSK